MFRKQLSVAICVTLGCGVFGAVYEYFSHGVYSPYMVYLFAIPLVGLVVPAALRAALPGRLRAWPGALHYCGIATLVIGAALQGIVEIYGTTTPYTVYYLLAGGGLLLLGVLQRFIAR